MATNGELKIERQPQLDITGDLATAGFTQCNTYRDGNGNVVLEYQDRHGNTRMVKYTTGMIEAYRPYDNVADPVDVDWDVLAFREPFEFSAGDAVQLMEVNNAK